MSNSEKWDKEEKKQTEFLNSITLQLSRMLSKIYHCDHNDYSIDLIQIDGGKDYPLTYGICYIKCKVCDFKYTPDVWWNKPGEQPSLTNYLNQKWR